MKTLNDFYKYIGECQRDVMEQFDAGDFGGDADVMYEYVNDYVLDYVDGLQEVIYYARAWNMIDVLRFDGQLFDDVERELLDNGYKFDGLDNYMCALARTAVMSWIGEGLYDLCEEACESFNESADAA